MDTWNGFRADEFEFEGRVATVVIPDNPKENAGWLIKTEYWNAFPQAETELVGMGFYNTYLQNKTRFATREDCDAKARFAKYVKEKYGLSEKCVPIGMSCGGAHAMNFAGFYPQLVSGIVIDAPVLNFLSYPGKLGDKECEGVWEREFKAAYPGVSRAGLLNFDNHPIGKAAVLKEKNIPVLMIYGTQDETVIYSENGGMLELEYADRPELLTVVQRPLQGHHPHCSNTAPVIEFVKKLYM